MKPEHLAIYRLVNGLKEVLRKAAIAKRKAALSPEGVTFINHKLDEVETLIEEWRAVK